MQDPNKENAPLELDDDFEAEFDDGFDPELDGDFDAGLEDYFYDDVLDDAFEAEGVETQNTSDDGFPDDPLETEDWDAQEFDDQFDESLVQAPNKKSGLSFNAIVIIGTLIVGAVILVLQVTGQKPTQMAQRFTSALSMSGASDGLIFGGDEQQDQTPNNNGAENPSTSSDDQEVDKDIASDKGFLFEPELLDSMQGEQMGDLTDVPPQPSPISNEIEDMGEVSLSLSDDNMLVDTSLLSDPGQVTEEVVPAPVDAVAMEPRAPEIAAPIKEIEVAEKLVQVPEIIEPVLEVKQEKVVPTPVVDPVVEIKDQDNEVAVRVENIPDVSSQDENQNLDGLQGKLDLIVSRLDQMEAQISNVQDGKESEISSLKAEIKTLSKAVKTQKSQPRAASKPKTVKKKVTPKKVAAAKPWVLKAAQPGKAWIARQGAKEIKAVQVGDNVQGIGRVQSILFVNGRWIVQGTSGQVKQ